MAYGDIEISQELGRPIRLYRFILGSTTWRYTSADEDLVIGGHTWQAIPIDDDGINQTGESTVDSLKITIDGLSGPALAFRGAPPTSTMQVAILLVHDGDHSDVQTTYVGEVSEVDYPTPNSALITCETLSASMRRSGLRLGWQRTCPYALYDPTTCKVDKGSYGIAGTVSAISGFVVTVPALAAQPNDRFNGGFIEWSDPVRGIERRSIEYQLGGVLTMFGSTYGIEVGTAITAYRGCARTMDACQTFSNLPNYGGYPHIPGKSPFDGDPVFY